MPLRVVTADTWLRWDHGVTLVERGTLVRVAPGSALEAAYGGNLR